MEKMYFVFYLWEIFQYLWNSNVTGKRNKTKGKSYIFNCLKRDKIKFWIKKLCTVFFLNRSLYSGKKILPFYILFITCLYSLLPSMWVGIRSRRHDFMCWYSQHCWSCAVNSNWFEQKDFQLFLFSDYWNVSPESCESVQDSRFRFPMI